MLCTDRHVFGSAKGVRSPFSCFTLSDSFSDVPRASGPVFMFCVPYLFSMVPTASGPVFMFSSPILVFSDTLGVGSRFHVLRAQHIFGGTVGVRSRFHVLHSLTRFRLCGGRQVPFSCFASPYSFSAIPWASDPVFMFCTPGLVFGDTECVGSRFHVLRARTHFRWYRRRPLPFSSFVQPDTFLTVWKASGPFFMFCAPGLDFGGFEGVGFRFHVLCPRTHFHW
jgi:hypothetical protein